jgi:hypothetical protein
MQALRGGLARRGPHVSELLRGRLRRRAHARSGREDTQRDDRGMSPATSMIGIVADAFATRTGTRSSRCVGLGALARRSVRGGPSSLVSRVKIANSEASPGSRASRARSMPFRRDCWYAVRLTPEPCPGKTGTNGRPFVAACGAQDVCDRRHSVMDCGASATGGRCDMPHVYAGGLDLQVSGREFWGQARPDRACP